MVFNDRQKIAVLAAFLALSAALFIVLQLQDDDEQLDAVGKSAEASGAETKNTTFAPSRVSKLKIKDLPIAKEAPAPEPLGPSPTEPQKSKYAKITFIDQHQNPFGDGVVFVPAKGKVLEFELAESGVCQLPVSESPVSLIVKRKASPPLLIEDVRITRDDTFTVEVAPAFAGRVKVEGDLPQERIQLFFHPCHDENLQAIQSKWSFSKRQTNTLRRIVEFTDKAGCIKVMGFAGVLYTASITIGTGYFLEGNLAEDLKLTFVHSNVEFLVDLKIARIVTGFLRYEGQESPLRNALVMMNWKRQVAEHNKMTFMDRQTSDSRGRFVMTASTGLNDALSISFAIKHDTGMFRFDVPVALARERETDLGIIIIPVSQKRSITVVDIDGSILEGAIVVVDEAVTFGPSGTDGEVEFEVPSVGKCRLEVAAKGFAAAHISRVDESRRLPRRVRLHRCASIEVKGDSRFSLQVESKDGSLFANLGGEISKLHGKLGASPSHSFNTSSKYGVATFNSAGGAVRVDGLRVPNDLTLILRRANTIGDAPTLHLRLDRASLFELSIDDFPETLPPETLTLRIVDEAGRLLPQSSVVVIRPGKIGDFIASPNKLGLVKLSVQVGVQFEIVVQALGHEKRRLEIRADSVGGAPIDIILRKK
ncbi:MAG: hypothetical protein V3W41_11905 [Planctomycetota bacterium]